MQSRVQPWFFYYHPPSYTQLHGKKSSKIAELERVDWIGVALLIAGLTLFLVGISWGGPAQPWTSPKILGLLISGAVAVVSFILYETLLTPQQPIVPMRFFRDLRGFTCLEIISATYGVINIALFVMWPQQVTYIFGSTVSSWQESAWLSTTAAFGLWWYRSPWTPHVVDWAHQVPDPGLLALDDGLPWCDGKHHCRAQVHGGCVLLPRRLDNRLGRSHCGNHRPICRRRRGSWCYLL
jgi:hypothetical protein